MQGKVIKSPALQRRAETKGQLTVYNQLQLYYFFENKSSHARALALRCQLKGWTAEAHVYWNNHFYYARRANKIAEMTGKQFARWAKEARIDFSLIPAQEVQ